MDQLSGQKSVVKAKFFHLRIVLGSIALFKEKVFAIVFASSDGEFSNFNNMGKEKDFDPIDQYEIRTVEQNFENKEGVKFVLEGRFGFGDALVEVVAGGPNLFPENNREEYM